MWKIILYLLIIIFKKVLEKSFIIIPFYRELNLESTNTNNSTEIINIIKKNIITTNINIGKPKQSFKVNIKSGEYFSYILSNDILDNETLEDISEAERYNSTLSLTYEYLQKTISFSWLFEPAIYMKEQLQIGNFENNITILQVGLVCIKEQIPYNSGIIGFGPYNFYEEKDIYQSNLITNLKSGNYIDSFNFFIEFDDLDDMKNMNGKIIIGGEPNDYNNKKYPKTNLGISRIPNYGSQVYWGFYVDNVTYKNMPLNISSKSWNDDLRANINIDYNYIGVNNEIKKILEDDFFGVLKQNKICEEIKSSDNGIFYVCYKDKINPSKLGNIKLYNIEQKKWFTIELKKLFYYYQNKAYFMMEFRYDYQFVLGMPFLKQYLLIFNQDLKMIKSYPNILDEDEINKKKRRNSTIVITLCFVGLIIVVLLLSYLLYKARASVPKRKKGIELVEDKYVAISK